MRFLTRLTGAVAALLAVTAVSACGSDLTAPSSSAADSPSQPPSGPSPSGPSIEFHMRVVSVDVPAGTLTLAGGTVVRVTSATAIDSRGDLFTLESTADAVAAGRPVRAEGSGTVESDGLSQVIAAGRLKVEVDD